MSDGTFSHFGGSEVVCSSHRASCTCIKLLISAAVCLVAGCCSLTVNVGIPCLAEGSLRTAVFLRNTLHSSAHWCLLYLKDFKHHTFTICIFPDCLLVRAITCVFQTFLNAK